jgi:hypothetical protein
MILPCSMKAQTIVYLFPGQGSDERIFSKFKFDPQYKIVNIQYPVPQKGTSLKDYAQQVSNQIDTTAKDYVFVGVSIGGMICSELCECFTPRKTIIISSAKCRSELPRRYKFMRAFPVYKIVPPGLMKIGARLLQPIVEPDRKKEKKTFVSMLKSKTPKYYKRTVAMIIKWDKKEYKENIFHIHGANDHTLPVSNVKADSIIKKGSHMMTLTRGEELFELVNKQLRD